MPGLAPTSESWGAVVQHLGAAETPRESPANAVVDAYQRVLCREPDSAGQAFWQSWLMSEFGLSDALAASPEGQRVLQVRSTYLDILGRDPLGADCAGLRNWIDGPFALDEIDSYIADSPEATRVNLVRQLYLNVLGRDPLGWDNAGLRRWVDSKLSLTEVRQELEAQRTLVGVHYFTWYRSGLNGWGNGASTVAKEASQPLLGWYASDDSGVMERHVEEMEATGFDVVIVHIVADDPKSWENARALFSHLEGRRLQGAILLDGLYDTEPATKAAWTEKVVDEFIRGPSYFSFQGQPLVLLFSAPIDFTRPGIDLRNIYWAERYDPGTNPFNPGGLLYATDWAFWAPLPQPVTNGMAPVMPGYDDVHLGRSLQMRYARNGGQLYHEQWVRAIQLRPELVLVYSWNEFFEATAIEPTEEWGDRYLQWTACYIDHAHAGTIGRCPTDER